MQARYYDPVLGRFLSTDPVTFSPDQPGYFNRYWYVGGNPVNYLDPFGLYEIKFKDGALEGLSNKQIHEARKRLKQAKKAARKLKDNLDDCGDDCAEFAEIYGEEGEEGFDILVTLEDAAGRNGLPNMAVTKVDEEGGYTVELNNAVFEYSRTKYSNEPMGIHNCPSCTITLGSESTISDTLGHELGHAWVHHSGQQSGDPQSNETKAHSVIDKVKSK